jgi:hypothetical protein
MMLNKKRRRSVAARNVLRRRTLGGRRYGARSRLWVTVYTVTRHYGGAEEGGWWYNWYTAQESSYTPVRFAEARARKLRKKWEMRRMFGDIYSVLGGEAVSVHIENTRYDAETTVRPHYE